MTPRQEQLRNELDQKAEELRSVETMEIASPEDEAARAEEIRSLVAGIEKLQEAFDLEEKVAEARSKVERVKASSSTSGVVIKPIAKAQPKKLTDVFLGEVRGVDSVEAADRIGRYLAAIAGNQEARAASAHPMGSVDTVEPDSMGELTPTYDGKGSELVQHELYRSILNQITHQSIATRLARLFPVATDGMYLPIGDQAPEAEFYAENTEIKPMKAPTARATLKLEKLGARAQVSNELLADAYVSLYQIVGQMFADSFARKIDKTYLQGDAGIGFGGVVASLDAGRVVTAAAATPTVAEWTSVISKTDPNVQNPVWLVSREGWQEVVEIATGAIGRDITQGVQMTIYGAPVFTTDYLPAKTLAVYGDFGMATAIGYKPNGLTIRASADRAIEFDQMVYVATQRLAFSVHSNKYLSALKIA